MEEQYKEEITARQPARCTIRHLEHPTIKESRSATCRARVVGWRRSRLRDIDKYGVAPGTRRRYGCLRMTPRFMDLPKFEGVVDRIL